MAADQPSIVALIARALDAHCVRTGRRLAQIRLLGVAAVLVLSVVMAYGAGQSDWADTVVVFGGYFVAALALWVVVQRSERAARRAGVGVALVDVPMVFWTSSMTPSDTTATFHTPDVLPTILQVLGIEQTYPTDGVARSVG